MTTREAVGLLALAACWLVLGYVLLHAAGVLRSREARLRGAGLALVTGWAATGLLVSFELMAGLAGTVPEILAGWVALAGVGLVAGRRRGPAKSSGLARAALRRPAVVGFALQLVVGGYLAALLVRSLLPLGQLNPDAWTQWLSKAKVIYFLGGLDAGPGGFTQQINPDYPPLDPALEATAFRFAGRADFLAVPLLHWIVFAGFVAAVAFLLRGRVPAYLVWGSLAMLVLAPKLSSLVGSSLADEPLALLVGLGGLTGTLWLLDDDPRLAALCALFLGAATLTKNEGLMLSLALAVILALGARRRLGLALLAVPVVVDAAWRVWLRAHDVPSNFGYDFGRLLHPIALAHHGAYLRYGSRSLLDHLFSPHEWLLIVPAALVLGLLAARRRSPLALLGLAFPALVFVGYSGIYWIGNGICTWMPSQPCDGTWHDIEWLVGPSADRIVASVAVLLACVFPLLVAHAGALDRRPATERPR
jgi:hypothetical protein